MRDGRKRADAGSLSKVQAIRVEGLSYRYPRSSAEAARGLEFQVARGEIFGFLGPSGAGKSTTLKILTGLLRGYSGRAEVLGVDLAACGKAGFSALYERIGVAFEFPYLYERFTARENLEFFAAFYERTGDFLPLLERVGLLPAADQRVEGFSKGMRMRLNFVRALLAAPELLFLDEPTGGLDPANSELVCAMVRERRDAGATVFLTTHQMQLAQELCDRVGFMVDGRLVLVDSPRELMLREGRRSVRAEWREGGALLSREFPMEGLADDAEFRGLLRSGKVETLHSAEASLKDIFIKLTGRDLE